MAEVRYFALRAGGPSGRESAVYTGRSPRQAALKAASRGEREIWLRERGTKKVHHFRGSREKVRAPENRPEWMPEMVWKPRVKKSGIVKLEREKRAATRRGARRSAGRSARGTTRRAGSRNTRRRR